MEPFIAKEYIRSITKQRNKEEKYKLVSFKCTGKIIISGIRKYWSLEWSWEHEEKHQQALPRLTEYDESFNHYLMLDTFPAFQVYKQNSQRI